MAAEYDYIRLFPVQESSNKYHVYKNYLDPIELLAMRQPIARQHPAQETQEGIFDVKTKQLFFNESYNKIFDSNDSLVLLGVYDITTNAYKYGMVDYQDQLIIPIEYDYLSFFSEGLAVVGKRNGEGWEYGFINQKNELIIPYQYYQITKNFKNGLAKGQIKKGIHVQDVEISKPDKH